MSPPAFHHVALGALLCISGGWSAPTMFYSSLEGSTDEEELTGSTRTPSAERLTTPAPLGEADFLRDLVKFLEENMLLILVATILIFIVFVIICGALMMIHRRRVNSYYPAAFPTKMYVDERDKNGGMRSFKEVKGQPAPEHEAAAVDSHKQLQDDIVRAARSLRAAGKTASAPEESEGCQRSEEEVEEEVLKANGDILEQQLSSVPEEKEPGEANETEAAAAAAEEGSPQRDPPEELQEEDDPSGSPSRILRPASLHLHNDSATLQLLAGEKTAF